MPKGLAVPVGVGSGGGLRIAKGAENDNKIVSLALGDNSNDNAFQQDLGLGSQSAFQVNDVSIRSVMMARLRKVFEDFKRQRRYDLIEDSIRIEQVTKGPDAEGGLLFEFKYISLEANEERTFTRQFIPASAGFGDR